jgi:hypothetical protein
VADARTLVYLCTPVSRHLQCDVLQAEFTDWRAGKNAPGDFD